MGGVLASPEEILEQAQRLQREVEAGAVAHAR
jgi:hypothetical protein